MATCKQCNKKLSLIETTIICKCTNNYCTKCRYPESHNCTYDYKKNNQIQLEKTLVKIEKSKIPSF